MRRAFAWAAAGALVIAFGQALTFFHVRADYDPPAWAALAISCLLAERGLRRWPRWSNMFRWTLGLSALALGGLALTLAAPLALLEALTRAQKLALGQSLANVGLVDLVNLPLHLGLRQPDFLPLTLTPALAVGLAVIGARLYRRRWPVFACAPLAGWALTMALLGYGARWFGRPLSLAEFGLGWTVLGGLHLLAGAALDARPTSYAHALHLGGWALAVAGWLAALSDRAVGVWAFGLLIGLAVGSHIWVHVGRHRSLDDLVHRLWPAQATEPARLARSLFAFLAAYAFPFWLTLLLAQLGLSLAVRGLGLALTAPLYVAGGLALRGRPGRGQPPLLNSWPLFSAGYALTAVGALLASESQVIVIPVLLLDVVVYAASAYIFRESFWLWLANLLLPVAGLFSLQYFGRLQPAWVAGGLLALAGVDFGLGLWLDRRRAAPAVGVRPLDAYALACLGPAFLLSAGGLAAATGDRSMAAWAFLYGLGLYALAAWIYRQPFFLYPAVWFSAVPYGLWLAQAPLDPAWRGLGWLPLMLASLALGRLVFGRRPGTRHWLERPSTPFYLLTYAFSVSMLALSAGGALPLSLAFAAAMALYAGSAILFQRESWLYPALLAGRLALLTALTIHPSGRPAVYASLPFLGLTWVLALAGYFLSRRFPAAHQAADAWIFRFGRRTARFERWPFLGHLSAPGWARPFFLFAAGDLLLWQSLALYRPETGLILAVGLALLLGWLALRWRDSGLAHGALALLALAAGVRLAWAGWAGADLFAAVGGVGLGMYLLGRWARRVQSKLWVGPALDLALLLTGLGLLVTLPQIGAHTTAAAAALAASGTLVLLWAADLRRLRLGYVGLTALQLAWALALIVNDVRQPQGYALPAGLFFVGVGYLERRRSPRLLALTIESFGLALLLLTSFIQALNGAAGFAYFLLLLVEALLVVAWGAIRRLRTPFFIGLGASVLNVLAQVVVLVNVYDVNRWLVVLGVGLVLMSLAVFVERQRNWLIARARAWLEVLEKWE